MVQQTVFLDRVKAVVASAVSMVSSFSAVLRVRHKDKKGQNSCYKVPPLCVLPSLRVATDKLRIDRCHDLSSSQQRVKAERS